MYEDSGTTCASGFRSQVFMAAAAATAVVWRVSCSLKGSLVYKGFYKGTIRVILGEFSKLGSLLVSFFCLRLSSDLELSVRPAANGMLLSAL